MVYVRKYDFQPGSRISSSQVDEEFNQLINAANILETGLKGKANSSQVQNYRITPDNGDVKYSLSTSAHDLYTVDGNLSTFYASKDVKNTPDNVNSFRGIYITKGMGNGFGELIAFGSDGSTWRNTKLGNVWQGWKKLISTGDLTQPRLWSGAIFMNAEQTVKPSKKLSECNNGWVLVWSDFDADTTTVNDFNWGFSYIPKFFTAIDQGGSTMFPIVNNQTDTALSFTGKVLYVNDSELIGHSSNTKTAINSDDVVLRYVYEF